MAFNRKTSQDISLISRTASSPCQHGKSCVDEESRGMWYADGKETGSRSTLCPRQSNFDFIWQL